MKYLILNHVKKSKEKIKIEIYFEDAIKGGERTRDNYLLREAVLVSNSFCKVWIFNYVTSLSAYEIYFFAFLCGFGRNGSRTLNFELRHHMIATGRYFLRRHYSLKSLQNKDSLRSKSFLGVAERRKTAERDFRCFARAKIRAKATKRKDGLGQNTA